MTGELLGDENQPAPWAPKLAAQEDSYICERRKLRNKSIISVLYVYFMSKKSKWTINDITHG